MNQSKLLFWSITVALAGFLFGFDTVVISGADQALQKLWNSPDWFHGIVVMSSALWGTVIGALFGSIPTDKLGRKKTLIFIGFLYIVGSLGSALVSNPWQFAFFRFIGGLGVGASTIAAPAYVSEIAPPEKRGRLVAMYQFNIVFGILIAYLSNFLFSSLELGANTWRWMLGVQVVPSVIYTLMVFTIPMSPRWLMMQGRYDEARSVLQQVNPHADINELMAAAKADSGHRKESLWLKKYRLPVLLAFLIAFFNQMSGINAFLYYAPRIFEIAGLEKSAAMLSSVGIGLINLIFTFVGLALIDKFGRRQLMYIGSFGYIISLGLVSLAFFLQWKGMAVPLFFFLFIAAHAIGQGTVIWVFISEIFPSHLRAQGQSLGSSTHWVLAAAIPAMIPFLFGSIGAAWVFVGFTVMMVLQLVFVIFMMPETKGVPLEELSQSLIKENVS
ncbi:Probable metabolite transport protein CsbC [Neisseria animaloris]|uniref:Probable metabolite transport protein CsbC n=1 Tax=Neisseria animaloris TaxID=326522 RepID=A0A1X3CK78_9NEIS|nr:sugar porter family MFS transporter [Neisseria animaloris]OSI07657.1 MFS transporter [Neisseria animaloris]VEH88284.1 Probable metabolite transport protein CsbC [Neisseria animaloris]VEJ21678.1 Probable metabolite transport protein CsbC [Neisseria animaloris]